LRGAGTALVDNGNGAAQLLLVNEDTLDAALVGAQDDQVLGRNVQAANVLVDDRPGVEVIDGDVEEALDLGGMEIERQGAVGPRHGEQVGHQLGCDWYAADVLAILPGVAIVGQDGSDAGRAGALEAVQQHQQLHEILVDRRAGRLDQEDVAAADILFDAHRDFAVG